MAGIYNSTSKEKKLFPGGKFKVPIRYCEEETETKQILGLTTINVKNGELTYAKRGVPCRRPPCNGRWFNDETRVDKNFYY